MLLLALWVIHFDQVMHRAPVYGAGRSSLGLSWDRDPDVAQGPVARRTLRRARPVAAASGGPGQRGREEPDSNG